MVRLAVVASVALALVAGARASSPEAIQARYDRARDLEEALLVRRAGGAELQRARAEIRWAERQDFRPPGWRGGRDIPHTPLPATWARARGERAVDTRLAARLAAVGAGYGGWAAFWVHDLATGRTAGWNADALFPAASTVKLGVLAAALRRYRYPERSHVWYDLRQLTGWSSNLAANRVVGKLGGLAPVYDGLRRLGMRSSTYPGPFRVGTSTGGDAPKPPPLAHTRVTTAHDLGRALYTLHAAAAGNRFVQRRSGLTRRAARLGLELLLYADTTGANAGLVRPFLGRMPVAQKSGWISDTRGTAALAYFPSGPKIVVVLAYRPGVTFAEGRALGARVVRLVR